MAMSKPAKRRRPQNAKVQSAPTKVTALAELVRVMEDAGTPRVSRDYFRANSRVGDAWSSYWPSFKEFLAAASMNDDLYYDALVEFVASR